MKRGKQIDSRAIPEASSCWDKWIRVGPAVCAITHGTHCTKTALQISVVLYIYIYSWDYSVVLLGLGRKKKKKKGKFRVRNECLFNISSPSYCVWRDHSASAALGTRHSRSNEMGSALVLHRLVYSQTTRPVNGWHDHTQVHKKLRRHLLASVINN